MSHITFDLIMIKLCPGLNQCSLPYKVNFAKWASVKCIRGRLKCSMIDILLKDIHDFGFTLKFESADP